MIAIITYDNPHRKTQDLISKLLIFGYKNIYLVIIPWKSRKNFIPIYKHRPSHATLIDLESMCLNLNIKYERVETLNLEVFFLNNNFDNIIIGGAGILPESLCKKFKIINSHPGYLPISKGLDSLKWAIFNDSPIGVTTHFISEQADEGLLIEKKIIPFYLEDSFYSLCLRVYETEIEMLVNAINLVQKKIAPLTDLNDEKYSANRRMPKDKELIMMKKFKLKRARMPSIYSK